MKLIIINSSPRVTIKSNTNIIIKAFIKGFTKNGNTAFVYHLSERGNYDGIFGNADAKNNSGGSA